MENDPTQNQIREIIRNFFNLANSTKNYLCMSLKNCEPKTRKILRRFHVDTDFIRAGLIGYVIGVMKSRTVIIQPLMWAMIFGGLWHMAKVNI